MRTWLPRVVIQLVAILFVIVAWNMLRETTRSDSVRTLGRSTEQGGDWTPEDVALWNASLARLQAERTCRSETLKAGLSMALERLDALQAQTGPEAWRTSLQQTRAYVDHALGCLPTDGNLWARRALLDMAQAQPMRVLLRDMVLSQRYAPAEDNVLTLRYRIWNALPAETLKRATSAVHADLRAVCGEPHLLRTLPPASDALRTVWGVKPAPAPVTGKAAPDRPDQAEPPAPASALSCGTGAA